MLAQVNPKENQHANLQTGYRRTDFNRFRPKRTGSVRATRQPDDTVADRHQWK
jgi:hypothetical protein